MKGHPDSGCTDWLAMNGQLADVGLKEPGPFFFIFFKVIAILVP